MKKEKLQRKYLTKFQYHFSDDSIIKLEPSSICYTVHVLEARKWQTLAPGWVNLLLDT